MAKLIRSKRPVRKSQLLIVGGLTAVVGILVFVRVFAAGSPTAFEAESGTLAGGTTVAAVSGASGGSAVKFGATVPPVGPLTAQDLSNINTKRIVFGHQSVGGNIMGGIPGVYSSYGVAEPQYTGGTAPTSGAYFMDFGVGANGDPEGKIADFNNRIRSGIGARADVAFFKFCWVDINNGKDVATLFSQYKITMDALAISYPNVKFLYVTDPLTTSDTADNDYREKYNTLLRNAYGATGRVFDLAKVESTAPDGVRVSGTYNGQTYYSLYPGYSSDGGHLNSVGSNLAAKELLTIIAAALR